MGYDSRQPEPAFGSMILDCAGERARREMFESYLQRLPIALVFVSADGDTIFSTRAGVRQYERWKRGAGPADARGRSAMLDLVNQVRACADQQDDGSGLVTHPRYAGFVARIERHAPTATGPEFYAITFLDDFSERESLRPPSGEALQTLKMLSQPEQRIALLAARGMRNKEIATQLCRSQRTVENHLISIYRKLRMSRRTLIRAFA